MDPAWTVSCPNRPPGLMVPDHGQVCPREAEGEVIASQRHFTSRHEWPLPVRPPLHLPEGRTAMNCFDCHELGHVTEAVAVCRLCGAAVCHQHGRVAPQTLHRPAGTGVSVRPRAARRILCVFCRDAERAG